MSTSKRPQFKHVMTPLGTFVWPKLNKPDTKWKADGEYGVKLRLSAKDSEALLEAIEKVGAESLAKAKAELEEQLDAATTGAKKATVRKAITDLKQADPSWKEAVDDDGNPTGDLEFAFKMPAVYTKDRGKPTEKKVPIRPAIFDARGKLMANPPDIWGGSEGYVSGELRPFYTQAVGAGVSLRLQAVQVTRLVQGGARDAAAYGFGKVEGGYEASDDEASDDEDSAPAGGGSADEGPSGGSKADPQDF